MSQPAARRRRALVPIMLAGVLAASLAGCRPTADTSGPDTPGPDTAGSSAPDRAAVPVGSSGQTITVAGRARTFRVYRPAALPATAPLVVMLHGGFGTGEQAESWYGWNAVADRAGFVVAYPDGQNRAWAVGEGCCGVPGATGVDDVAFITAVVANIAGRLPIDPRRVYATGISNGGMMSYRLACQTSLFAAIGPDSATLLGSCPSPAPVSVIHVHGTADHSIRYGGGPGEGVAKIDGPAVPAVIDTWRAVDRCSPPSVSTVGAVTTSTADCPDGRTVELITIDGAGHQWPGSDPKPVIQKVLGTDPPSDALDATTTIWQFFAAHVRPAG